MTSISKLTFFDREIIFLNEIKSTNDYIKEIKSDLPIAVFTEFQTNGRGQREKYWESNAEENILISFSYPTDILAQHVGMIIYSLSLDLYQLFEKIFQEKKIEEHIAIKWPNDIILKGKKLMGILIESSISGDKATQLIIGIGWNIHQTIFSEDNPRAGSLQSIFPDINWERDVLVEKLINCIENFAAKPFVFNEEMQKRYNDILYKKNEFISIENQGKFIHQGIDNQGRLNLKNSTNGEIIKLNSTTGIRWDY